MNDRELGRALAARLGSESLARLRALRRRLWLSRAVRYAVVTLAAVAGALALVQLVARSVALEWAAAMMLGLAVIGLVTWAVATWRARPSLLPLHVDRMRSSRCASDSARPPRS